MVRVPVIANQQKPLINARLKADFKGRLGTTLKTIESAFNIPISIGNIMWDNDAFEIKELKHDSAKIKFTLYNWREDGSISVSVMDNKGTYHLQNFQISSDLRWALQNSEKKIGDTLVVTELASLGDLQPETNYRMQMHFKTQGRTYDSAWYEFRAAPLPRYEVKLHIANFTQGNVEISPKEKSYPLGSKITLTAHPEPGRKLASWVVNHKNMGNQNPLELTVEGDMEVIPNFVIEQEPQLDDKKGGCSQGPQASSWKSMAALLLLAFFFRRKWAKPA